MGVCESLFSGEKKSSPPQVVKRTNHKNNNFFSAPVHESQKNNKDNGYIDNSVSQMTMTVDRSQIFEPQKPEVYRYINKYKTNTTQRSLAKESLVECGNGRGNSLMLSNTKSRHYTSIISKIDDTEYESSYDGVEMIVDGVIDESLLKKTNDKNTINNYNEFIGKQKEDNNVNGKVIDFYNKPLVEKNSKSLNEEEEEQKKKKQEEDELSGIAPLDVNKENNLNGNNKNNEEMKRYIQSMGKY